LTHISFFEPRWPHFNFSEFQVYVRALETGPFALARLFVPPLPAARSPGTLSFHSVVLEMMR
jgi:hypothetical protein